MTIAAGAYLGVLSVIAVVTPWIAPHDPIVQDLPNRLAGPSSTYWLGTDELGRDLLSRLLYGARISIAASAFAVLVGFTLGVPLGFIASYTGGLFDWVVSRIADALQSIPGLVLALALVAVLGPGPWKAMFAVGVVFAPRFYRIARAAGLSCINELYIEASRAIGCRASRVILVHLVPNALGPIVVQMSLALGFGFLSEAALSYIGLGVQLPDPSWGTMLNRGARVMATAPLLVVYPGVLIMMSILAANLLGDGLRDALGRER